jgi:hypothetical protein
LNELLAAFCNAVVGDGKQSVLGQKRRFDRAPGMSALSPMATRLLHYGNRRFGPRTDIEAFFKMPDPVAPISILPAV